MSGHSKWATIKHKKGAVDAKRGKMFTKLIRELSIAARMGGSDPDGNPRVRRAISDAKAQQMPNETIQRALKRGAGELDDISYEEVLYEGTGPGASLILVEGMTDNRNRTVAELRKIFERHGGVMGGSGTAAWAFDRKGVVVVDGAVTEDTLMDIAVGAGADDYAREGDTWSLTMPVESIEPVAKALEQASITVHSAAPGYIAKNKKTLAERDVEVALNLMELIDDNDDVQNVFIDVQFDEQSGEQSSEQPSEESQ